MPNVFYMACNACREDAKLLIGFISEVAEEAAKEEQKRKEHQSTLE